MSSSVTIEFDEDTWQLISELAHQLGHQPDQWVESLVRLWLGRPGTETLLDMTERLRQVEAPVKSWPEMEMVLMQTCLGKS
ncbi:MAG: hypothetical protein MI924_04365 [Chloroflexales bacterium]|nr:hypothetical protein [Chloroflexales bacterium]